MARTPTERRERTRALESLVRTHMETRFTDIWADQDLSRLRHEVAQIVSYIGRVLSEERTTERDSRALLNALLSKDAEQAELIRDLLQRRNIETLAGYAVTLADLVVEAEAALDRSTFAFGGVHTPMINTIVDLLAAEDRGDWWAVDVHAAHFQQVVAQLAKTADSETRYYGVLDRVRRDNHRRDPARMRPVRGSQPTGFSALPDEPPHGSGA